MSLRSYGKVIRNLCVQKVFLAIWIGLAAKSIVSLSVRPLSPQVFQKYWQYMKRIRFIYLYKKSIYIYLAFEIQLQSTSAIKCQGNSTIFQFASAMRRQNILPKTQWKPFYITSAMASASAFCRSLWFGFLTVESTCST